MVSEGVAKGWCRHRGNVLCIGIVEFMYVAVGVADV